MSDESAPSTGQSDPSGDITVQGSVGGTGIAIGHGARAEVHHHYPPPPPPQPKFLVPFPQNEHFVGRDDDLQHLHAALQKGEAVGIRPAMLTGMGGIGKTQLAVEYAYRYQSDYPGGVYWVNAAQDWRDELALLAVQVGLRADDVSESERRLRLVLTFVDFLDAHPNALLILDNVEDPRLLRTPAPGFLPSELTCHLLFTTRRHTPDLPFESIDVDVLPEQAAFELLLYSTARREILARLKAGSIGPETGAVRTICKSLGYLPLAIALAAAYLGKYPQVSLMGYLRRLEKEGGLETVDASGIDPLDSPTRHGTAVKATLKSQWDALQSENARLALRAAALLGEGIAIPHARLALFTGLSLESEEGYPAPLDEALLALYDLSLIEKLSGGEVRLHPLVRKFAEATLTDRQVFAEACVTRLADAHWDFSQLHRAVATRGIDSVLEDLRCGISMAPGALPLGVQQDVRERLTTLLRPLDFEAHLLRIWNFDRQPGFFLQQLRNRCLNLNIHDGLPRAEATITGWHLAYLRERFRTTCESAALVRTLDGHTGHVNDVAVTPDNRFAVSASSDRTLKIWELRTGQCINTLESHSDAVNSVAVTLDASLIISGSSDHTVKVWKFDSGQIVMTLGAESVPVNSVAVTSDGRLVVAALADGNLKVWDLTTGQALQTLRGHLFAAMRVVVIPYSHLAISASFDGTLNLWDLDAGNAVKTLSGHSHTVHSAAVTIDGRLAVSASHDRTFKVWNLATGQVIKTINGHQPFFYGNNLAVTPDGRFIVSGEDEFIKIWDLETGQVQRSLDGHLLSVTGVVVTSTGQSIVSASQDKTIKLWNLAISNEGRIVEGHTSSVSSVAIIPDSRCAVSVSGDGSLKIWDIDTGLVLRTLKERSSPIRDLAVASDGQFAITASDDRMLQQWDLRNGKILQTLVGHADGVFSVVISRDKRLAVSASQDKTVRVWELGSGHTTKVLEGHTQLVSGIVLTPDDRFAISSSWDKTLRVWELATGRIVKVILDHAAIVRSIAITPDGRWVVAALDNGTLRIWEIATGQPVGTLEGHRSLVRSVAVMPYGRFVVSTSADGTLNIWDIRTGQLVHTLATNAMLSRCAITPDERLIITGDTAGALHFIEWVTGNDHQTVLVDAPCSLEH